MVRVPENTHDLSILHAHPSLLPGPNLLHELVAPSSSAVAIDFLEYGSKKRAFSYEQLHVLSGSLARRITETLTKLKDASPIIPVLLPQSPELYIVLLAILKAGKAFCPLNLDTPAERLRFILEDVSADLLLTNSTIHGYLDFPSHLTILDVDYELHRSDKVAKQLPQARPEHLAYVLYTSGSTGLPKAVSVSHRAVTQSLIAHTRHIPAFSRFLQFASPTFDVSIFEIFFPWYKAATLVGRTRSEMLDDLPSTIRTLEVDAAELTPTVVTNLLGGRSSVPGLKLLFTIGEMLTPDVIKEYGGTATRDSILWAMYGPTEASIHCTLQPRISAFAPTTSIGYPLDTVSAFIVKPSRESEGSTKFVILPVGTEGELAVGGPQIANEYLNRPELTATSFVHHPDYGWVYRTGDRARLRHDGNLECLGRVVAGQIKLRGQRVELGEVEQIIMKVDHCRATVVMVIEDSLVAFCAVGSHDVSHDDVSQMCMRWLPEIMVPSHVLFVSVMPQLPSGKIDKASLIRLYRQSLQGDGSTTDTGLYNANSSILDMIEFHLNQPLTLDSNLASTGLNSLQAIKLASRLRSAGFRISTIQLLSATKVSDILKMSTESQANGIHLPKEIPVEDVMKKLPELRVWRADISHVLPCTPLQEAMLAETMKRPNAYCNWIEVEFAELYTYADIRQAISRLAFLNQILRSGFCLGDKHCGTFLQIVWKGLDSSQVQQVNEFSRPFSLGSLESLLRPLHVQIRRHKGKAQLLFQIHHALYDGWSFDLMLRDLDDLLHGQDVPPRPQFRQVVRYFQDQAGLAGPREEAEQYWSSHLSGHPPSTVPNYNGKLIEGRITSSWRGRSSVKPQTLSQRAGEILCSPQVFFQAALAYVLSLYTGSDDVVMGNVTSGRTIPITGIEDIIGPCIASLPFRLRFRDLADVRSILEETQRINLASLEHALLPLRDIARAANVRTGTALYDALFVWQQSLDLNLATDSSTHVVDNADNLECKVTFEVEPHSDHIMIRATFDPAYFPVGQIEYLSRQLDETVQLFLRDLDCPASDISKSFTASTLSISNAMPRQSPIQHGLSHAVEQWAMREPDKEAIVFGHINGGSMRVKAATTYAALNQNANRLARHISSKGIRAGDLVGIVMEKSIDLYAAILAVIKTGAGYLPLVPDLPSERVRTILHNAQVDVCISDSSALTRLREQTSSHVIDLDTIDLSCYENHDLDTPYEGANVAYAVFTSGSTGTPKGVLVTQENLMSNLEYLSHLYPFTTESRLLQSCSQAFDVSVFEIFFAWHVGMCLCSATKDDLFFDIEDAINSLNITHLSLTPTVAALVDPERVPRVKFLVTAGEAVTEQVRRNWAGRGLYQGYGPSETTNICTVKPSVSSTDLINNIGRPFANTSAFVIDPDSATFLPRGAVGELCFGGYQVFKGYLNRPELTAAKIIHHPQYGRIYRSGDLGIMLPDDSILFVGRLDDQVKIRGQRVELGEITSAVLDVEVVQDCMTLLIPNHQQSDLLAAFWVPVANSLPDFYVLDTQNIRSTTLDIYASLLNRLPSYMMPSHLIPVSRLPMTAQGKIDKRRLTECFHSIDQQSLDCATHYQDKSNDENITDAWEIRVRDLLADTLRTPPGNIRRSSSFFTLGLDSVSAISLGNALRKAGLGNFAISTILRCSTIALLSTQKNTSASSNQRPREELARPEEALDSGEVSRIRQMYGKISQCCKIRPCTPLQEAMLSSGASSSSGSTYTNAIVFTINGDLKRLQHAWATIFERHEILRTSFVATNDPSHAWAQVIWEVASIRWGMVNASNGARARADKMIRNLLDTDRPPVWLAVAEEQHRTSLLFCCHHAMYDGTAIRTLLAEVQDVYHHRQVPPPVSYDLYLQQMLSQDLKLVDQFWEASFKGFEPAYFPDLTGRSQPRRQSSSTWRKELQLPLSEIRQACQNLSWSLLSVVHATWAKLLHLYTGESDLCFGNVVSGRAFPDHDFDRLVAPCFNTLPVRVNFDFRKDNASLAEQTHTSSLNSLEHQLTPLRRIQKLVVRDEGRLFDTLLILQQPSEPLDETIWTLREDSGDMDLPLVCEIIQDQSKDRLEVLIHYNSTVLSESEARIVADTFEFSLTTLIQHPNAPANDAIGLPKHLRAESNLQYEAMKTNELLHSSFGCNARTYPERIALDFAHGNGMRTTWSFNDLNEKANDIAHALIARGTKPEDIVAIHVSKSPLFYASVLGVLKAGAAFAPVHPDLPDARKCLMLEELAAKVILIAKDQDTPSTLPFGDILNVQVVDRTTKGDPVIEGLTSSNIAYCLFTSGSTGTPKAVSMEHCAPIQTIESSRALIPWDPSSRLLQYAAVTFDMCYYDCFLAWSFGFTLCAAEQQMMLDELPKTINELRVDLLDLTPSVAASLTRGEVPRVRWLYCIGETMTPDIVEAWQDACVNSYGPTEAAFCTTIQPVSKDVKTAVIGRPFPSTSFAVFSAYGERPLPVLSVGELYIGGAQLARGYLGKSDLTVERFVSKCGQRFYRSGDMVRMLSDGSFEFIGRADDQVKIRGLRVELGEINHVLQSSHDEVKSAVTQILKKNTSAKEQLVSFLATNHPIDNKVQEEIRGHLRQKAKNFLPAYMVPRFFIFVDIVPRSLAGKIDKEALADIFRRSPEVDELTNGLSTHTYDYQWTDIERLIREVFAKLSRSALEDVLPSTTIYQLGLDSISAVQVAAALRREGYGLNSADVMKYLTCVDIAAHLIQATRSQQSPQATFDFESFDATHRATILSAHNPAIGEIEAILPCTPLQEGMLSQMLAKDGNVYINFLRLELRRDVDMERMREAWRQIMQKHPILRTGFTHLQDKKQPFAMIVYKSSAIKLPWYTSTDNTAPETADEWLEKMRGRAAVDFYRPLWQIRIVFDSQNAYLDIAIFHALFDAQSLQSIFQDVLSAYVGQAVQSAPSLRTVVDGIIQRSKDQEGEGRKFWDDMSKQATPCRFPNLSPLRQEVQLPGICIYQSAQSLHAMEKACRQANTTIQAVGLASWLSLIAAYTGERTATCGLVLAGRTFEAAEDAVFPCINTVPFSCELTGDDKKTLDLVTGLLAGVQQHQHIPLSRIQKLMGYPNEALFDSIFAYQKLPSQKTRNNLWAIVDEKATIEYPVSIELELKEDRLEYRLTIMPHTIPQKQANLMLKQFDHLIQYFLFPNANSEEVQESLYSVTPAKESVLQSGIQFLHDFVEQTAAKYPQRRALEFADSIDRGSYSARTWTYHELDCEGNKIAHLLIHNGVRPCDLVGVCFDKCPEASFAMLGVLKAGCAFVAIDPAAPAARQRFIVEDSGATAVLSMTAHSVGFAAHVVVPTLNLDEASTASCPSTTPVLQRQISPQDRSYCLYTSGTTGTPKGCELTHENAVQALLFFQRIFAGHWNAESRWLQFASFHFDVSVLEQYWSWSIGICVVSAPRDVIFEDLPNSINTLGITHIDLTPSLAQLLHPEDVPSLCKGVFITGGESLKQEILDIWGPKAVIYNGYGPTETTIGCTMYPRVPANGKPSNIGWQFDNVGTLVLRPDSDVPVLRGGIGELCVSGKLVGKGYLNRKELTDKSFPYLARFSERVYRTGDLVRILHDDSFEFLGRADDQVKLRGQRLEIGEINSVIRQSNRQVTDVATMVLKHPRQQKDQLVSFVVYGRAKTDCEVLLNAPFDTTNVKEACHEKLPPYMVPTHFVCLTSMPLNVNNKADGKKLRNLYNKVSAADLYKLSNSSVDQDQAWSDQEANVRLVLMKELDVNQDAIGKDTSFFELGMDSISVIGVARAMKMADFKNVTASMIMAHSTLRRLSKVMSTSMATTAKDAALLAAQQWIAATQHRYRRTVAQCVGISTINIEALAPCTPLQQGMIARSLESKEGLYFNTFQFELTDDVEDQRLRAAWQTVFDAFGILRTNFTNTEDGFVQAVLRNVDLPWITDSTVKNESIEDCVARLRSRWLEANEQNFIRPFELIHVHSHGEQQLVMHIFHGLYDGISIELIFKAVWDAYNGRQPSKDAPDFQSVLAHGPLRVSQESKKFWQQHVSFRFARPFPLLAVNATDKPIKVTRELRDLGELELTRRKLNVTAQAIAQACWLSVLHQHTKTATTIGVVVSGRSIDLEHSDQIVGPMFNTIPYQHHLHQKETWVSIIKRVHEFNVSVNPHQHTALRDIAKWCGMDRRQALFNTLFVYQVAQGEAEWAQNEAWRLSSGDTVADYPLAFEVEQRGNEAWALTLVAQGHVADVVTLNTLLEDFEKKLDQIIGDESAEVYTIEANGAADDKEPERSREVSNGIHPSSNFTWNNTAKALREALADLTGSELHDVNKTTSIFELGLDSIDAIKLSSRLKNRNLDLPVSGIMRGLTIEGMLSQIRSTNHTTQKDDSNEYELESQQAELMSYFEQRNFDMSRVEAVLPLTPLQEGMVAEMIRSDFRRYYNFDVMEISQEANVEKLRDAWVRVVEASPILRTSFMGIDDPELRDSFGQIVNTQSHKFWDHITTASTPDFPALFEELRHRETQLALSEPPFHVLLIESPIRSHLVLSLAHALYDGWSLGLLHADVQSAYNGTFQPRPNYQPALSSILSTTAADATAFWQDYLSGSKRSTFAHTRKQQDAAPQIVHRLEHSSRISANDITIFAKKANISVQTLGQAVYAMVLSSYVRSLDVVFGSVLSGRDDEMASQLIFPTMNTVAIRIILHGTRLELLRHVQDSFMNLKQYQHFPLRKALTLAGVHGGLFESLFIYQKSVDIAVQDQPHLYISVEGYSDVEYAVCVEMEMAHDELKWRCAVKDEFFDKRGTKELFSRLDMVLEEIMRGPDKPVLDLTSDGTSVCGLPPFTNSETTSTLDTDGKPFQVHHMHSTEQLQAIQAIREALATVSGTPRDEITKETTIFHIGLDSISAIKVSSLLRTKGISLSVGDMLRAGTISQMACVLDARPAQEAKTKPLGEVALQKLLRSVDQYAIKQRAKLAGVPAASVDGLRVLPVTPGQQYMLSVWLNTKGSNMYHEFEYTLDGRSTSLDDLNDAWRTIVATNSIFRTWFISTSSLQHPYVQVVEENVGKHLHTEVLDESTSSCASQESEILQPWARLFRTHITDHGCGIKLKIHHALYDGVSLPILVQQLQNLCNGLAASSPTNIFSKLLLSQCTESAIKSRRAFWIHYLGGLKQSRLPHPAATPLKRVEIFKPALLLSDTLEKTTRNNGVSWHALFLAVYAELYAALTYKSGSPDVIVGVYLANRSDDGIASAAIPTVNLLPLRIRSPYAHVDDLIASAKEIQKDLREISTPDNASASLFEISEWTGIRVDTFVNFLSLPDAETQEVASSDGNVRIVPAQTGQWTEPRSEVVDRAAKFTTEHEASLQKYLVNERVNEAYLHAVDVEVAIRNGSLDIGVFAPAEMLGLTEGEKLTGELKEHLESFKAFE
ncbi:hypothetical protein EK21DRAFT_72050 [Setomelanomma holmii]|uniref:Carrier domain-containing protein n=1 Tax=Setomelanomma holmii TaxID=210430 RepID=A0A9P4LJN4_9PLEO|nr:hypothetical protein EK21DRAFT_72050 [Setomelanomma holmii]